MADVDGILYIQLLYQFRQIIGVGVHIVAVPRLAGAAVSAAIVRDASISARGEKYHLIFPGIGAERPSVTKNQRLPFAPILVVKLCSIFHFDRSHAISPLRLHLLPESARTLPHST